LEQTGRIPACFVIKDSLESGKIEAIPIVKDSHDEPG
jgi:hypothetical protein